MKPYDKYKASGIEWLGEIPEHWEVKRVKDIFSVINGSTPESSKENFWDGEINWITPADMLDFGQIGEGSRSIAKDGYLSCGTTILPIGSIILSSRAPIGKVNLSTQKLCTNQGCKSLVNNKQDNLYFYYLLFSLQKVLTSYGRGTTFMELGTNDLKNIKLLLPPHNTQTAIANYLNTKTTAIDRKIDLLTAKADKYKALRRSLINETVCRGLNPNAPMKDSGIEWIGKIPEHWQKFRMKDIGFLYSGLSGKAGDDFNQDDNQNNCDFIPFTNIFNNETINPDIMGKVVVLENEKQNRVKKNDIFFLMSSEDYDGLGKSSLLNYDLKNTYLNSFCKGFRLTKKKIFPAFLNYQLQSDTFRKIMQIEGKGFTRMNLKSEKVTGFEIFIPDTIEEQKKIVDFLDEKTTQIDSILNNITEQINKLTQLRRTLINDVVTGKIKVTQ